MPSATDPHDPTIARAARDAVMHHVDFLHSVAGDPAAPRGERLQAIELLARLAELGRPSGAGARGEARSAGKTAAKSAGKHAAKHSAKHATKHAGKQASKHAGKQAGKHAAKSSLKSAAKHAARSVSDGGRKHLAGEDGPKRLASPATKALPPARD
jgi:hypothetical protein